MSGNYIKSNNYTTSVYMLFIYGRAATHTSLIGLDYKLMGKLACNFCIASEIDLEICTPSCAGFILMLVHSPQDVPVRTSKIEGPIISISFSTQESILASGPHKLNTLSL